MPAGSDDADEPATLQSRLEQAGDGRRAGHPADLTIGDPVALLRHLDASGHFHRDSSFGRLFHRGMVSLRENVATESLHISIDGNRVAAHVDEVSPLAVEARGRSRYSVRRAVRHNIVVMTMDLLWLLRGRQGDHSSVLNCEWEAGDAPALLDPRAAAWSVQVEARVEHTLDETALRAALASALGDRATRPDLLTVVDCPDAASLDAARAELQSTAIAVTDAPPMAAYLARQSGGDVLMLNLNGAAADGVAAMEVLHAIARAYAGAENGPRRGLDFLAARDLPVRPAGSSTSIPSRAFTRTVEWLRDKLARIGRLAADGATERDGYGYHMVALSADETGHVVAGTEPGTERNVLMAALHLAIGDWNLQHGTPGRRIGVLVPANLRPEDWQREAIGNFSVTARISTNRRERAGASAALDAVNAQRARNKRTRSGVALIAGLQRAGLLALWAKQSGVVLQPLTANRHVDTAMLCDLGWMDEPPSFGSGAGATSELWFSAPARSPLSLCVGAVATGGRLHLTFRYPLRLFDSDAAGRFAACYLVHVRSVADSRC